MARDKEGKWLPGESGNPAGRPVGAYSKAKEWQDEFFKGDKDMAKEDWGKLSPFQRWSIRSKYWDFQFPKLRSEYLDMSLDNMSDETAGKIVASILQNKLIDENEIRLRGPNEWDKDNSGNNKG